MPGSCVDYGTYRWMDPADARAAEWSLRVLADIVERYDVDGLHIDDYFYPYPEGKLPFPDQQRYAAYREGGGKLSLGDWRRSHIDSFVQRLNATVHRTKPWVQFGISPFGIARPGVPRGIEAGVDQYAHLYADVEKWLREGWFDYISPQLYWPIDQQKQAFGTLLPWWLEQNKKKRHVWPGLDASRILEGKPPVRPDELAQQIDLVRAAGQPSGHVLFSFKALEGQKSNVVAALRAKYRAPALVPASPWLGGAAPHAPVANVTRQRTVSWAADPDARFAAVQVRSRDGWRLHAVVGNDVGTCRLPDDADIVAVTAIGRTGVASQPAVVAVP